MAKATLEDKILKKEMLIENLNNQIDEAKKKLASATKELQALKDEKEFNSIIKLKDSFYSIEDVNSFIEAVKNKDIETIKKLLNANETKATELNADET